MYQEEALPFSVHETEAEVIVWSETETEEGVGQAGISSNVTSSSVIREDAPSGTTLLKAI